ncbi:1-phosphofructokinase [Jeotgalibacillus proteolyticus]|uniref:Tagatose-6-phosphate kinase n=1 Tax=Jeotgalibacillus proteolyticus TaxID=2082395 RepID=A0A2S5G9N6_9BACL|nr:1-phosphofructokinase [Jeotgalibacillus proteolyticus]PPA69689.1 1-phosphofructokinase [Jeotgalibacillus proteolyticus]
MILTVTLNPSVDYVVRVDKLNEGGLNRTNDTAFFAGGKGINVSQVLKELGIHSTATGFTGGFSGHFIEQSLDDKEITADFIHVEEPSRINIKLKTEQETEINAAGPAISETDVEALFELIGRYGEGDILVLAGSIPESVPKKLYGLLAKKAHDLGMKIVIDAEKSLLEPALTTPLHFIKPNHKELSGYVGEKINTIEEAVKHGRQFYNHHDIEYLMISMAEKGAILIHRDEVYVAEPPAGNLVNSVGAGDSSVAGFLAGLERDLTINDALALSMACGASTAFSEGLATINDIQHYQPLVNIRRSEK